MIIVSAGDAITAKLIQQEGFDGIWVSGFETSARLGLPDDGSITMTEMLQETRKIIDAVRIPVYVDVDTGYGNLTRTAKEFERIGAYAICVEDNVYPKKNSLFGGEEPLENMYTYGERLEKAKKASKIKIIARTEALIRGRGLNEALTRAGYYYGQGADYLLIHTRDTTGKEALDVAKAVSEVGGAPLAIVPTKFPNITVSCLTRMGYKLIIWANQTERIKIKAIKEGLRLMKHADCPLPIENGLSATLEDLRGLTDVV